MLNTPAAKAKLRAGDRILEIDKDTTQNLSLDEAAELLRGPMDSLVRLKIQQERDGKIRVVKLRRSKISVSSVSGRKLKDEIGYLKIDHFQEQTIIEVTEKLHLWKDNLRGLIIDLRQNPGGLLEQAISISDLFLSEGKIVTTVGYQKEPTQVHEATFDTIDKKTDIVVLVNEQSASASEILAAALQSNKRAHVFGRPTYGKGSVQVLFEFPNKWGLKLTVAQYLTPNDASIQDIGVQPDVWLKGFSPTAIEVRHETDSLNKRKPNHLKLQLSYLSSKDPKDREIKDPEIEIARQFLVRKTNRSQQTQAFHLNRVIETMRPQYTRDLEQAFNVSNLHWYEPRCTPKASVSVDLDVDRQTGVQSIESWQPSISISNASQEKLGAMYLSIRSGDVSKRLNIGGLAGGQRVTVKPDSPVKLFSQNGQCLINIAIEDGCGNVMERQDLLLRCPSEPTIASRSNLIFNDRQSGNGNGILEFGEKGRLHLRVLPNQRRAPGKVSASLALLGEPRQRLVRLINGHSEKHLERSAPVAKHEAPMVFDFEIEAKKMNTVARSRPQKLLLEIKDEHGQHLVYKTVVLTLYPPEPQTHLGQFQDRVRSSSSLSVRDNAALRFQPDDKSEVVAQATGTLTAIGRRGDWLLVELPSGFAWLNQSDRRILDAPAKTDQHLPPFKLRFNRGGEINFEQRSLVTTNASFLLRGAFSGVDLKDYRFFHNGKKTVYAAINEPSVIGHPFETRFELKPGVNRLDAVLRSKSGYETSRTFYVTRQEATR
ncbi:MAG: S41 family peptidase, partial [Bradymonadia bacterium]